MEMMTLMGDDDGRVEDPGGESRECWRPDQPLETPLNQQMVSVFNILVKAYSRY